MKAWDAICKPPDQGGLGIKQFGEFNKAMLGMQAWKILQNRDSILSKVYFAKYYKNNKGHHFKCNSLASPLARPICKRINEILSESQWRLGNGQSIKLRDALWIPPDLNVSNFQTVSQLLDDEGNWDRQKVLTIYNEDKANRLFDMPTSHHDTCDKLVWAKNGRGIYTVKDAYSQSVLPSTPTTQPILWKKFWKLPSPPKVLLFGWKCLQHALPLGSQLS